ncbi:MAG: ABC transporter substrate-binding protein [Alphaproteobacteria bacterium]|nr:ABC transporter substrate-binding protein [Alphaproteobacteria bacterium]
MNMGARIVGAAMAVALVSGWVLSSALAQNTLVVAGVATAANLDGDITQPGTIETAVNVYEGLTKYATRRTADGRIEVDPSRMEPHLATQWEVSPDGRVYTFTLRRGVKSPFGNELTADDVVFGWQKSQHQKQFGSFIIRVGRAVNVEAVARDKVRFTLETPNRVFLGAAYTYAPGIYDSVEAKKHVADDDPFAAKWLGKNTAGYGAYHVISSKPGEGMVWEANPNYFEGAPFYSRIVYREIPSAANRVALIRSGAVQWAEDIPLQQLVDLRNDRNVKIESVPGTGSAEVRMNPKFKPFDDVRVRRAIVMATDFNGIGSAVFRDAGTRVRSIISPAFLGHAETYTYENNVEQAKKLLAEAGFPSGLNIALEYSNRYWWEEGLAVQMKNSLATAGINLDLKRITATEMVNRRVAGTTSLPFFTMSINSFVLEPSYLLLAVAHSKGIANYSAYSNPEIDAVIDEMFVERDDAKYLALVKKAQEIHAADAAYVNTFYPGTHAVMAACISGWLWQPHERTVFKNLRCNR